MKIKVILLVVCLAVLAACGPGKQAGSASGETYTCPMHPQIVQEGPGTCPICFMDLVPVSRNGGGQEIMLSEEQIELAGIRTQPVEAAALYSSSILAGELQANQELSKAVSSRVGGRIEKLYLRESGATLRKGAPLYEIYSEELQSLQREFLLALEQYEQLGAGDKRYAAILEAARKKLLLYGMEESQLEELARSKALQERVLFRAPVSGLVREVMVSEGQYVQEGSPLYRVEGLDPLWLAAELYPGELDMVKPGDVVRVVVNGFEDSPREGKVIFMNPEYSRSSQILLMRVEVDNPRGELAPGMQAQVILEKGGSRGLSLPAEAVIREEQGAHVWLLKGENIFVPRQVETGMEQAGRIEIRKGLEEGDTVVMSGAYLLYSELLLKKGPLEAEAGHAHGAHHAPSPEEF